MKFIELVRKRQSVRKYLPEMVPRDVLNKCLEAARLAPSACNSQPWSFIVVDDEKIRNKLAEKAFSGIYSLNSFAKKAPIYIVVVTQRSKYTACLAGYFKGTQYSLIDIGIACEHFILQATEEGLGTCWLGWFNEKEVKKVLGIPGRNKVDIIISMGYPQIAQLHNKKRKLLNEISRFY
ncbi:nitroreductase family protein [bacterium]|nr:nitroreductase family protein [bacterium]